MTDISSWTFLIIGLLGGFSLSIVFWWMLNHYLVPDLQFSDEISRSEVGFYKSSVRHQIAIKNCGRRDAYNVKFRVRLKIKDILQNGGTLWDFMDLETSGKEFFVLKKGSMFRVTPVVHRTLGFSRTIFPAHIQKLYEEQTLSLDDIFNEFHDVRVFIEVIATDRFSGGAKYFRSKEYSRNDIRNGVFWGNEHLVLHKQKRRAERVDKK